MSEEDDDDEGGGGGNDDGSPPNGSNGSARAKRRRKITVGVKSLTRDRLREGWREVGGKLGQAFDAEQRPRTWGECRATNDRPCPWVSCKFHLYLDVMPETGSIILNFPDLEPWELTHTCALDVAARGGLMLEEVGKVMNLTRERVRQIEVRAITRKLFPQLTGRGFENEE